MPWIGIHATGIFMHNLHTQEDRSLYVIAAPVKKGTKKHGKVHRQGKRKEARYP
jgi:hypothetical protein